MKIGGRVTGTHQRVSFDAASHATTSQLHLSRGAFHDSPVGGTVYQVPKFRVVHAHRLDTHQRHQPAHNKPNRETSATMPFALKVRHMVSLERW